MVLAKEVEHVFADVGRVQAVEVQADSEHEIPGAPVKTPCLQAVQRQRLGGLEYTQAGGRVAVEIKQYLVGNLLYHFALRKQGGEAEMPDINHLEAHLLELGHLFLPPLAAVVLDELAALNPGRTIPGQNPAPPSLYAPACSCCAA